MNVIVPSFSKLLHFCNHYTTLIFRVNELSVWRMNFSRSVRVPRPIAEFNDTATSSAVTVRGTRDVSTLQQDNLLRQLVLISSSAENPLEKLSRAQRLRQSSLSPPFSSPHTLIRGMRVEITRDCLGIDRDLIIAPASFPVDYF